MATEDNVLIYKRTHIGDPNRYGEFGVNKCMGQMRDWNYDAVIGVGGWTADDNIDCKLNWVGIKPAKIKDRKGNTIVTFEHFCLYEEQGECLKNLAPKLFHYMFEAKQVRHVMSKSLPENILREINGIINRARNCPESTNTEASKRNSKHCTNP